MVSVSAAQPVAATIAFGGDARREQRGEPAGALGRRKRLAFAGRPERRDAVDPLREEPVRVSREARVVDAALAIDRRQHRAPEALDGVIGQVCHGIRWYSSGADASAAASQ